MFHAQTKKFWGQIGLTVYYGR